MQSQQPDSTENWRIPQETSTRAPYQSLDEEPQEVESSSIGDDADRDDSSLVQEESSMHDINEESDEALIRWQGTEYLYQNRSMIWYVVLVIVTLGLVLVAIIVMHSFTFALLLPVMAAALVIYTRRPPVVNDYILSRKGLHINDTLYTFSQFRSFGVVSHNGAHSILLVPRKRFQIAQNIYFPEEIGEQVVDMFGQRLPMKEGGPDVIDRISSRLHL